MVSPALPDDTWDMDYVYERMLIDLPVNGQTRKPGHFRQTRHARGNRPHQRRMALAQGDGLSEPGHRGYPKTGAKTINVALIPRNGQGVTTCPTNPGARAGRHGL